MNQAELSEREKDLLHLEADVTDCFEMLQKLIEMVRYARQVGNLRSYNAHLDGVEDQAKEAMVDLCVALMASTKERMQILPIAKD
jgi:t-SNARE complex subunit (syntaxin)